MAEADICWSSKSEVTPADTCQPISVGLEGDALWRLFNDHTNEMIVTKGGRKMFPLLKVRITGLDPKAMYNLEVRFAQTDAHKWKYLIGTWMTSAESEPSKQQAVHRHPDSPNYGSYWMRGTTVFNAIKLTNKPPSSPEDSNKVTLLQSLHKYLPKIHIVKIGQPHENKETVGVFSFEQTQFIAVTAYQNNEITELKIRHNPFAKGFQKETHPVNGFQGRRQAQPFVQGRERLGSADLSSDDTAASGFSLEGGLIRQSTVEDPPDLIRSVGPQPYYPPLSIEQSNQQRVGSSFASQAQTIVSPHSSHPGAYSNQNVQAMSWRGQGIVSSTLTWVPPAVPHTQSFPHSPQYTPANSGVNASNTFMDWPQQPLPPLHTSNNNNDHGKRLASNREHGDYNHREGRPKLQNDYKLYGGHSKHFNYPQ